MNTFKIIKNDKFRILDSIQGRLLVYFFLMAIYFKYMASSSYLGIDWLPFYKSRVIQAVQNIMNGEEYIKFGFTSWLATFKKIGNDSISSQVSAYLIPIYQYLHLAFLSKIGFGSDQIISIAQMLNRLSIFISAAIVGEISIKLIKNLGNLNKNIIGISAFMIFLASPWTYKMILAPWQEVEFLLFLLLSIVCFYLNKKNIGILFYLLASFCQYQWGFFLSITYALIFVTAQISSENTNLNSYFPPGFRDRIKSLKIIFSGLIPTLLLIIQNLSIKISNLITNVKIIKINSSLLYRLGIDDYSNIHHGGWISTLQFFSGNRFSACFSKTIHGINLEGADQIANSPNIYLFNCLSSLSGMFFISLASLIGVYLLIKNSHESHWVLSPVLIAFSIFCFLFQQSFSVHLMGYSYVFAFIYTLGLLSLIQIVLKKFIDRSFSSIAIIPILSAILFTSVRVSFLTGING